MTRRRVLGVDAAWTDTHCSGVALVEIDGGAPRLIAVARSLGEAVSQRDGASIAWLYQNGRVVEQQDEDLDTLITVMLPPADVARFEHRLRRGVKKKKNARQSREKV